MTKYKIYFKKNLLMMLLLVFVILIGLLFINFFSENNFENNSLGGSFSLTDQNGNNFDSSKLKKKNLFILGTPFVQMFVRLIY
jgi:cytochrome oxidase Cu insertion factor (SCO1/SenC/PrrC family)